MSLDQIKSPSTRIAARKALHDFNAREEAKRAEIRRAVDAAFEREEREGRPHTPAPTPAERMKAAVSKAVAGSADPTERKRIALSALRGIGAGLTPLSLDDLTRETAAAVGCSYAEAVLALTTEDAR